MKRPRTSRRQSRMATATLALLSLFAQSAAAGTVTFGTTAPTPGANDVFNFAGAATDSANVRDGGTYANGGANDAFTYIAGDRANQGQTFTTGANVGGYAVAAVWVQHAAYTANTDLTWYRQATGAILRARITRPAQVGTAGFVFDDETYTIQAGDVGKLPEGVTNSANGTGTWMKFTFSTPVVLTPGTVYGFDLTTPSGTQFFELHGTSTDSVAGGSAYKGNVNGAAGGPDTTLTALNGDRVFLVELAAVGTTPTFASQPSSYTGVVGASFDLAATATGTPAPTYKWQKSTNGGGTWTDVPAATSATLSFAPATYANNGLYRLLAINSAGTVPSDPVSVTLAYPAPTITGGSSSATVLDGTDVVLDVDATGVGTLTYQWSFAGSPLSGQTSPSLDLGTIAPGEAGSYTVTITDPAGIADGFAATTTTRQIDLSVISSSVATVAYYRFEEGSEGATISSATDSTGTNVLSSLGSPTYASNPALPTVPRTGAANTRTAQFATNANNGLFAATDGALATTAFTDFTIEFYVRLDNLDRWQTFVGREDTASPGEGTGPEALLYIQKAGGVTGSGLDDAFRIELITKDNRNLQLHSQYIPEVGAWYHVAVVGSSLDGTLALYVNGALIQSVPGFNGLFVPSAGAAAPWLIGRGEFDNNPGDFLQGNLDEVRFSQVALPPSRFLRSDSDSNLPPPVITTTPRHATARVGTATSFTVAATGQGNLTYQWSKGGSPVGTGATLNLASLNTANAGTYSVTISDDAGVASGFPPATTTVSATLQVVDAPLPSRALSLNFVGSSDAALNGNYAADLGSLSTAESAGFLPVANWINSATTTFVATSPAPLALAENTGAASPALATWTAANTWGALASGGTAASKAADRRLFHGYVESRAATGASVTVSNIPYASYDVYIYVAGGASGNVGSVAIDRAGAPTTFYRPLAHDTFTGAATPLPFMLGASTTLAAAQSAPAASFVRFAAVTGSDLTISAIDGVLGANAGGIAGIQIVDRTPAGSAYPPSVPTAPISQIKQGGSSVTFTASAVSNNPGGVLSYQWRRNGENIFGQTGASYTRTALIGADSATYSVVVTDTAPGLGSSSTTRSASLVVVDATRSLLINGDLNTAATPTYIGDGILRADGTASAGTLEATPTTWNGILGGAGSATRTLAKDSTGLSLPGVTFSYSGATGVEDNTALGDIAGTVAEELERDYLFAAAGSVDPLTGSIGGLQALAGKQVTLYVYAIGKTTKTGTATTTALVNDTATISLAEANNHLAAPAFTTSVLGFGGSADYGRNIEFNTPLDPFNVDPTTSAYATFTGVVAADGTVAWSLMPDTSPGGGGLVPLTGFQLLVTDTNVAPPVPAGLTATLSGANVNLTWSATLGTTSYTVRRATSVQGPYQILSAGALTATSYTDTSALAGTTYHYVVAAANALATSADSVSASVTTGSSSTPVQTWRSGFFGTTANTGTAANTADPDADGHNNLLEYALDGNPLDAEGALVTSGVTGGKLTLGFTPVVDASLTYQVEASNDLGASWSVIHTYPTFASTAAVSFEDVIAISASPTSRRFLRLKITAVE